MHAILYFRKQIWTQARRSIHEQPDIHARLMSRYVQGKINYCPRLLMFNIYKFPNGGISVFS